MLNAVVSDALMLEAFAHRALMAPKGSWSLLLCRMRRFSKPPEQQCYAGCADSRLDAPILEPLACRMRRLESLRLMYTGRDPPTTPPCSERGGVAF